jgi:hypothetical protein
VQRHRRLAIKSVAWTRETDIFFIASSTSLEKPLEERPPHHFFTQAKYIIVF